MIRKNLKDMSLSELRQECKPIFERKEKERRQRIDKVLCSLGISREVF